MSFPPDSPINVAMVPTGQLELQAPARKKVKRKPRPKPMVLVPVEFKLQGSAVFDPADQSLKIEIHTRRSKRKRSSSSKP